MAGLFIDGPCEGKEVDTGLVDMYGGLWVYPCGADFIFVIITIKNLTEYISQYNISKKIKILNIFPTTISCKNPWINLSIFFIPTS